jgi:hypothetical protein
LRFRFVVGLRRTERPAKTTKGGTPSVPEDRHQRPTIVPAFDPEDFARESESRPRSEPVEVDGESVERLRAAVDWDKTLLVVAVPLDELKRHSLDSATGFLLSLLDGATDVETVVDISGLPRPLVLAHLRGLLERGIIARRGG